jgi:hypothetical protein
LGALASSAAFAQAPQLLGYQGRLTKNDGTPETGSAQFKFDFFAASTAGSPLWEEMQTLTLTNGYYSTYLGKSTTFPPTLFDNGTLYLEIAVKASGDPDFQPMSPRQQVGAVAWALSCRSLKGGTVDATSVSINGAPVLSTPATCAANQVLQYNGSAWACATVSGASGTPDNGCPGALFGATCLLKWDNTQATNFGAAAQTCANLGGDICTDSQLYPITSSWNQNQYLGSTILNSPHWTAAFADDDSLLWYIVNGGTGDNNAANASYGYACCGGARPANPRQPIFTSTSGVKYTFIHDVSDTNFAGAVATCAAFGSDLCTDSQVLLLRQDGKLAAKTWTNSHSDNDGSLYNAINGGTADDTAASYQYGFACCPSLRPMSLQCPVAATSGVCMISVHNTTTATFAAAAADCAGQGADLCSMAQSAVLRVANALTASKVWTNSHSDNDAMNASTAVGSAMPDNPNLTTDLSAYACCLN